MTDAIKARRMADILGGRLRRSGGAVVALAVLLGAAVHAGSGLAETRRPDLAATYGVSSVAAAEILSSDRASLAAFSRTEGFRRAVGLPAAAPTIPVPGGDGAPEEALDALSAADLAISDTLMGARGEELARLMSVDTGGAVGMEMIDLVEVDPSGAEWECLAEALYFEARGETLAGQFAVAEVILNRADSARFPDTVCAVVRQRNSRGCQFSYTCDGRSDRIRERDAYELVGKIAWIMLQGRPRTLTARATYYHTNNVAPRWSRSFVRTAVIGDHIFYREPVRVTTN